MKIRYLLAALLFSAFSSSFALAENSGDFVDESFNCRLRDTQYSGSPCYAAKLRAKEARKIRRDDENARTIRRAEREEYDRRETHTRRDRDREDYDERRERREYQEYRDRDGRGTRECGPMVTREGTPSFNLAPAQASAEAAWSERVRWRYGEHMMTFKYSKEPHMRCSQSDLPEGWINKAEAAVGKAKIRCEVRARPCPAPEELELAVDIDKTGPKALHSERSDQDDARVK